MRSQAPPLMPIFRSRHQADLLSWLLLHPDNEYTMSDLARRLDVPLNTMHREAQRLVDARLLNSRSVGRARVLSANQTHRAMKPLTQLLELTFGPRAVVAEEFAEIPQTERVIIYGSWAERYEGVVGAPPNDIDVLVVGRPDRADVYEAGDRAQDRLGIEVNPTLRSPEAWASNDDPLVAQIKTSAHLQVLPILTGEMA